MDDEAIHKKTIEFQKTMRTPDRIRRVEEVLSQRQDDLTLVLSNIHDPHNVSAIYRSCDAFGVSGVYLHYTKTPFPALGEKSSASARKWVYSKRFKKTDELLEHLRNQNYQILATTFGPKSRSYLDWDLTLPTAIILGNEHSGVEEEMTDGADGEIHIPMRGMIQSLNVSVAAAVLLAEAARQREEAGFYAQRRISAEEYNRRLAEWLEK